MRIVILLRLTTLPEGVDVFKHTCFVECLRDNL
jgi:hypothetical protein